MRHPVSVHKWFIRITLLEEQVPTVKDLLNQLLKEVSAEDDAYATFELGEKKEGPHVHMIMTCKGSKDYVSKVIKRTFSIPPNSGRYMCSEFLESFDSYGYLSKGSTGRDSAPVVVIDSVGRNHSLLQERYWAKKDEDKKKLNHYARERKKKTVNFKDEYLARVQEAQITEYRPLIKLCFDMCAEYSKPINMFYCESLIKIAYYMYGGTYAREDMIDQMFKRVTR